MKDFLTRAAIVFIVVLFVLTGLGIGLYGFWQATHPQEDSAQQSADSTETSECAGGTESDVKTLPKPEVYKPAGKVEKLETTDLQEGSGEAVKAGDCLVMKYYGTLASNGEVFDQNFDKPEGFRFQLGSGQVIQGWDQGLAGMKVDGTRRLVIPAALAYGEQSPSASIPANSDLVFVVHLVSVK